MLVCAEDTLQLFIDNDCLMYPSLPLPLPAFLHTTPKHTRPPNRPLAANAMSDEEIAWRLHQELNAASPLVRTRSRRGGGGKLTFAKHTYFLQYRFNILGSINEIHIILFFLIALSVSFGSRCRQQSP